MKRYDFSLDKLHKSYTRFIKKFHLTQDYTRKCFEVQNNKTRQNRSNEPEGMEPIRKYIKDLLDEIKDEKSKVERWTNIEKVAINEAEREAAHRLTREHQFKASGLEIALGRFLYLFEVPQKINEYLRQPEAFKYYCRTCDLIFPLDQLDREDSGEAGYWLKVCPHCRNSPSEVHEVWRE